MPIIVILLLGVLGVTSLPGAQAQVPAPWQALFDGETLTGWSGDSELWRVEDGTIIGEGVAGAAVEKTDYLWHDSHWTDFILEAQFRLTGGNSGIQYRSHRRGDGAAVGPQIDLDQQNSYTGMFYESEGRGIVTSRGFAWYLDDEVAGKTGALARTEPTVAALGDGQWHTMRILARGNSVRHEIDGVALCVYRDEHPRRASSGQFGLQIHGGGPMRVEWRGIRARPWHPYDGDPYDDCPRGNPSTPEQGQVPHWIWPQQQTREGDQAHLLRQFEVESKASDALLIVAADNHGRVLLDGREVLNNDNWQQPTQVEIGTLAAGNHTLEVFARNDGGPAAIAVRLEWSAADGTARSVISDREWTFNDDGEIGSVHDHGAVASTLAPWGDVPFSTIDRSSSWHLPPGFVAEPIARAGDGQGSWVCLTEEAPGRLIVSPQYGPLLRVILPTAEGEEAQVETIGTELGFAQGLLVTDDALWVHVCRNPDAGGGLYRLRDNDGDGQYEESVRLSEYGSGSEHGNHGLVLGEDGWIYTVVGNYVKVPEGLTTGDAYRDYAEDLIVERLWDPNGHAVGKVSPAGQVLRYHPGENRWQRLAGGFRNPYDLTFHHDGELFTYDADMEWDIGTPWYRTPRVFLVTPGTEAGWRGGNGKWVDGVPDAVEPALETDLSSPTGVASGLDSTFPGIWKQAIYLGDWAYGRILAYFPQERGATWGGRYETFVSGKPLNVADMTFASDGAMYLVTGGRRTRSALHRIRWQAPEREVVDAPLTAEGKNARELRRRLEKLAAGADPLSIDEIWKHLGSPDRAIRFAARIALERLEVDGWRQRIGQDEGPRELEALLALVRVGSDSDSDIALSRLVDLGASDPSGPAPLLEKMAAVRVASVAISRHGDRSELLRIALLARFDGAYPTTERPLNRLLAPLLLRLEAPDLALRLARDGRARGDASGALDAVTLGRLVERDWSAEARTAMASLFESLKAAEGGNSFGGYVKAAAEELARRSGAEGVTITAPSPPVLPDRVRSWQLDDLLSLVATPATPTPTEEMGWAAFDRALCSRCHRLSGRGGGHGPDLTGALLRFSRRDLLKAIVEPSEAISDQYSWSVLESADDVVVGRIVGRDDDRIVLNVDPFGYQRVEIPADAVVNEELSPISPMPPGLLDCLDSKQIQALLGLLERAAGGS